MNPRTQLDLLFVGDVMLGRLLNDVLKHEAPEYPWGNTLPLFRQADSARPIGAPAIWNA